jgi:large subunit ribosomal protein L28
MARRCMISGKETVSGHKVSHSQIKTKRTFKSNIQTKNLMNPATGRMMKVKLSVYALRILRKWDREGKMYDLSLAK